MSPPSSVTPPKSYIRFEKWDRKTGERQSFIICEKCECEITEENDVTQRTNENEQLCPDCVLKKRPERIKAKNANLSDSSLKSQDSQENSAWLICGGITALVLALLLYYCGTKNSELDRASKTLIDPKQELKVLKKDFPKQGNKTWHTIHHLLADNESVNSLVLLYNGSSETSDCMAKKIGWAYYHARGFNNEDLIFFQDHQGDLEYGEYLESYCEKIRSRGLLITRQLHKVSPRNARMFHTLCDSVTPKISPSLYIFTLLDDAERHLTPISKASSILEKTWSELKENELHALLSRVVTNVIEVIPEDNIPC